MLLDLILHPSLRILGLQLCFRIRWRDPTAAVRGGGPHHRHHGQGLGRRTAGGVHPLREGHQHVVLRVVHHARDSEPVVGRLATAMPPTPTAAVAVDVGEGRCGAVARVATGRREGGVPVRALRPRDHAEVREAAPRRRGIRRRGREEADQRQGGGAEGLAGRGEAAGAVELLGVAEGVELGLARRGDRRGGRAVACRPPQQPRTMSEPDGTG